MFKEIDYPQPRRRHPKGFWPALAARVKGLPPNRAIVLESRHDQASAYWACWRYGVKVVTGKLPNGQGYGVWRAK